MDEYLHRYELNVDGMMSALAEILLERGYRTVQQGDTWWFETHWGRGAAYGEIGSLLYGILSKQLREIGKD